MEYWKFERRWRLVLRLDRHEWAGRVDRDYRESDERDQSWRVADYIRDEIEWARDYGCCCRLIRFIARREEVWESVVQRNWRNVALDCCI